MRKQITGNGSGGDPAAEDVAWLDLEQLARAELTSEDAQYPIESALALHGGDGWRAQHPGKQTIRLQFDEPQRISRILLVFREDEQERTQEFVLRWSADGEPPLREIVRQQYHFSPPGTTREREEYRVELDGLTLLELSINPDIGGGESRAALAQLRLA